MYEIIRIAVMNNRTWSVLETPYPTIRELVAMSYDGFIDYQEVGNPVTRQIKIKDIPYLMSDLDTAIDVYLLAYNGPLFDESHKRSVRRPKHIRYIDFWDYGYTAERGCWALGKTVINPDANHSDIYIGKGTALTEPKDNVDKLLYLVNGRVFFPEVVNDKVYLRNAYYRLNRKERQSMGIIDFTQLGGFKKEILTEAMVTVKESNHIYSIVNIRPTVNMYDYYLPDIDSAVITIDKLTAGDYWVFVGSSKVTVSTFSLLLEAQKDVYETVNGTDVLVCTDDEVKQLYKRLSKAVFLIIRGHLFQLEQGYVIGDDGLIQVKLYHRKIVGMADSPMEEQDWIKPANGRFLGFDLNTLDIEKYVTSGNSAVLIVDNDRLAMMVEYLQTSGFNGEYLHYRAPRGILYQCDGTIGEYMIRDWDFDLVALSVSEPRTVERIVNTIHSTQITNMANVPTIQPKTRRSAKMVDYYAL
jgi:hypothetical protein